MPSDTIRSWLSEHPRAIRVLFVLGVLLVEGVSAAAAGGGGASHGP